MQMSIDRNPFDSDVPSEYDHFSPDGAFIGSTSGVVPLALDDAQMIGLERDSLGVESVVKYEVTIPKGSALTRVCCWQGKHRGSGALAWRLALRVGIVVL
jgi:hypothetical protein